MKRNNARTISLICVLLPPEVSYKVSGSCESYFVIGLIIQFGQQVSWKFSPVLRQLTPNR